MSRPPTSNALRRIPSITLRVVLETLQQLDAAQYANLLREAKLEAYRSALPPPTFDPSITEAEMSQLYGSVFRLMGEPLTRLFFANYGRLIAPRVLTNALGEQVRQETHAVAPAQRRKALVHAIAKMVTGALNPMTASEDERYFYLSFDHCPFCAHIRGAVDPLCSGPATMYSMIGRDILGAPTRFEEVTCVASGGARCTFRLLK